MAEYSALIEIRGDWSGLSSRRDLTSGASSYYGFDQRGNARLLLGSSSTPEQYLYTAFGTELNTGASTSNPFRYGGEWGYYRDDPARLYVRARHLDTSKGRWLSPDMPGAAPDGTNIYASVENRPCVLTHPSGDQGQSIRPRGNAQSRAAGSGQCTGVALPVRAPVVHPNKCRHYKRVHDHSGCYWCVLDTLCLYAKLNRALEMNNQQAIDCNNWIEANKWCHTHYPIRTLCRVPKPRPCVIVGIQGHGNIVQEPGTIITEVINGMKMGGWPVLEYTSDIPQASTQHVSTIQNINALLRYDPIPRATEIYKHISHHSSADCMCIVGYSRGGGLATLVSDMAVLSERSPAGRSIRPRVLATVDPIYRVPYGGSDRGCMTSRGIAVFQANFYAETPVPVLPDVVLGGCPVAGADINQLVAGTSHTGDRGIQYNIGLRAQVLNLFRQRCHSTKGVKPL